MKNKLFDQLRSIVGDKNIITNQQDLEKFNKDWRGFFNNKSLCVDFSKRYQKHLSI